MFLITIREIKLINEIIEQSSQHSDRVFWELAESCRNALSGIGVVV